MPDMLKNEKIYHSIDIIEMQNYNKEKRMYPTDTKIDEKSNKTIYKNNIMDTTKQKGGKNEFQREIYRNIEPQRHRRKDRI